MTRREETQQKLVGIWCLCGAFVEPLRSLSIDWFSVGDGASICGEFRRELCRSMVPSHPNFPLFPKQTNTAGILTETESSRCFLTETELPKRSLRNGCFFWGGIPKRCLVGVFLPKRSFRNGRDFDDNGVCSGAFFKPKSREYSQCF